MFSGSPMRSGMTVETTNGMPELSPVEAQRKMLDTLMRRRSKRQKQLSPYTLGTPIQDAQRQGKPVGGDMPGMGFPTPTQQGNASRQQQPANSAIPSRERKKQLRDAYQQGDVAGAGGTRAQDRSARNVTTTGKGMQEGENPSFLDRMRQRQAERATEEQQRQYAQNLAKQRQNEKRIGGVGRIAGMAGAALARGTPLGKSFAAMAKNPEGVGKAMGRMAERERDLKRLNDQQRRAWMKEKGIKNKAKAFLKRPRKQQGIQARQHSTGAWVALIGLAVIKDLLDIGTLELISWIDWMVDVGIGIIFWFALGKGNLEFAQKILRTLAPMITEMIPGLGILPVWSFSVMYIYWRSELQTSVPSKPEVKKLPG